MAINKLSDSDISEIKRLLADGTEQKLIAKKFGITQPDVSEIKNGKNYNRYHNYQSGNYVCSLSRATKEIIRTIAANLGMKPSEFLKMKILKIIEETPDHLKRPPLDY